MRHIHLLCAALLMVALPLLCACGDDSTTEVSRDAATGAAVPVRWIQSKPNPSIGRLEAAVVARDASDRARVEARWTRSGAVAGCSLEIVLPDGVRLLEGQRLVGVDPDEFAGSGAWLLDHDRDRPLDIVVRFCAVAGDGERSCEVALRIADGPTDGPTRADR